MSDIEELLDRTVRSVDVTPSTETVEADVRRGRDALARRRRTRAIRFSVAGMAAIAALVGTAMTVVDPRGTDESAGPAPSPSVGAQQGAGEATSVRLVAYRGEQLEGFTVDRVPKGWYLQGSNAFRLTVAPSGDGSSPDSFVGKLVVMLLSSSAPQTLPKGEPVEVGGHDGVVTHQGEADTLTYEDDAGRFVQIQAWRDTLSWSNEQLARFAEGVTVTGDAEAGVG